MSYPVFVSFYCGDRYYYDSADRLRQDCENLGIPHDIEELKLDTGMDWSQICRKKSAFYSRKLEEHKKPIFWLDVDTRVISKPNIFREASYDFAAFLRNFKYFKTYDPVQFARTFHPGFLYFNYTENARAFAARIAECEQTMSNNGTDDFFLQEAWQIFERQMDIAILAPKRIARTTEESSEAWFSFGESGNVKDFSSKVEQHEASVFNKARQYTVIKKIALEDISKNKLSSASVFLRKLMEIDNTQDDIIGTFGRVLKRQKKLPEAITLYDTRAKDILTAEGATTRYYKILVNYLDFLIDAQQIEVAEKVVVEIQESKDPHYANIGKSRAFRLFLERRAIDLNITTERVRLWWMEQPYPGNFGDIVNPYIIDKLSGIPPKLVAAGAGVLAIGSVIKFAKAGTIVWGSGSPRLTDKLSADAEYRAVRGPLTRRLVIDSGGHCPAVFGDPALLLPFIYTPKTKRKYKVGLIRHFTHKQDLIGVDPLIKEIDIFRVGFQEIEEFLDELWECEVIVSTSLHGIIVAHAYGIPAVWATVATEEKGIPGGDVKFSDYFASVGLYDLKPLDLSAVEMLTAAALEGMATSIFSDPDYAALLAAAPMPINLSIPNLNRRSVVAGMQR